ncbi:MAG: hypothetical protein ACODAJ_05080 [Planctomycetota bacterium]
MTSRNLTHFISPALLLVSLASAFAAEQPHTLRVEIRAGLGEANTSTWDLKVTLPGQQPTVLEGLPHRHADRAALGWLGFASLADERTAFYLDNVTLTNEQ